MSNLVPQLDAETVELIAIVDHDLKIARSSPARYKGLV